jgi:disulfide bond formation protein DsbB
MPSSTSKFEYYLIIGFYLLLLIGFIIAILNSSMPYQVYLIVIYLLSCITGIYIVKMRERTQRASWRALTERHARA